MKLSLRPILSLVSLLLVSSASLQAAGLDDYNVVWDSPSADSAGSMPLGNGEIALNAWVEPSGDLLFYIARTDAWSGSLENPHHGAYGLLKVGRVRVSLSPNPFANATGFRQELKLRDGAIETSAGPDGKKSRLRLWVDANRPVVQVEAACADPVQMKVAMESLRTAPTEWLGADTIVSGQKDRVVWYYKSQNTQVPQMLNRTHRCRHSRRWPRQRGRHRLAIRQTANPPARQHPPAHRPVRHPGGVDFQARRPSRRHQHHCRKTRHGKPTAHGGRNSGTAATFSSPPAKNPAR